MNNTDIELVIKIPEESYKNIVKQVNKKDYPDMSTGRAIANGIVLPKGHGKLGDLDAISLADINFFSIGDYHKMVKKLTDALIIKADKAESEDTE